MMIRLIKFYLILIFIYENKINGNETNQTAIEILQVTIRKDDIQRYVQLDNQIWTNFLRQQSGFQWKKTLLPSNELMINASEIYHIIQWKTYQDWKKIPIETLNKVNEKFLNELGYQPIMKSFPDDDGLKYF